jgi:hypothetical protein
LAVTVFAVHVPSWVAVEDELAVLDEVEVVGADPKARSQLDDEAIVPVAATSLLTSATAAVPVRNVLAADALRGSPPNETKIAAPPTTRRRTMANSFKRIDDPPNRGTGVVAPDGRTVDRSGEKSMR